MTLISTVLILLLLIRLVKSNCPCCNVTYRPIQQGCIPFQSVNLVTILPKRDSIPHPKQIPQFKQGLWISSSPSDLYREGDIWRQNAIRLMWQERENFNPTPNIIIKSPKFPNTEFIFKDESFSPTSSSSYRSAWKLIFWALLEGLIKENTHVLDASFGNMAISEAYFMQILRLKYTAIIPESIDKNRLLLLETYNAAVVLTKSNQLLSKAAELAESNGGFVLNQYANGKNMLVVDENCLASSGNLNVMAELSAQLFIDNKQLVLPDYFISSAGTGSTISSVGHFVKKYDLPISIVLADTEFSAYFDYVIYGRFVNDSSDALWIDPGLDGLGFGQFDLATIEDSTSLNANFIDRSIKVPDLASVAAMHYLRSINIDAGPSTGISFISALSIASKDTKTKKPNKVLRIAMLISDPGSFYIETYYNQTWIDIKMEGHGGFKIMQCWFEVIQQSFQSFNDPLEVGAKKCPSPIQELLNNL